MYFLACHIPYTGLSDSLTLIKFIQGVSFERFYLEKYGIGPSQQDKIA